MAAVWGGSFLFLHVAAPVVGPVGLAAFRVTSAVLFLLPIVLLKRDGAQLLRYTRPLLVCGLLAFGMPFLCLSVAARHLPAGLLCRHTNPSGARERQAQRRLKVLGGEP